MIGFWIGAAVLSAVALAFLVLPLWRQRKVSGGWSLSALAVAVLMVPVAFGLYLQVRTWQPELIERRAAESALVEQLAERMRENPENVEGWRLLGNSYAALGEYTAARRAFEEAMRRTPDPDSALRLSLAEAQVLEDQSALTGDPGKVFEDVLAEEPTNAAALWYGAHRALALGEVTSARQRLSRLIEVGVPEDIEQVIRAQLTQLGGLEEEPPREASEGPAIQVAVTLGDDVSVDALSPEAALFIFARAPGGGPPVAVIRAPASAVPGQFVLSDDDAMLPGSSLADFAELDLVARLSPSGQPIETAGDLYGEQRYRPGDGDSIELVIDKVVP